MYESLLDAEIEQSHNPEPEQVPEKTTQPTIVEPKKKRGRPKKVVPTESPPPIISSGELYVDPPQSEDKHLAKILPKVVIGNHTGPPRFTGNQFVDDGRLCAKDKEYDRVKSANSERAPRRPEQKLYDVTCGYCNNNFQVPAQLLPKKDPLDPSYNPKYRCNSCILR